jgi:hypothetical protein
MTDRLHHLRPALHNHSLRELQQPAEPPELSTNDVNRRVAVHTAADSLVPHEPKWAQSDGDRLALLMERVGDVAAAYGRAHTDIDGEVLKVIATAQAWAEARLRDKAR